MPPNKEHLPDGPHFDICFLINLATNWATHTEPFSVQEKAWVSPSRSIIRWALGTCAEICQPWSRVKISSKCIMGIKLITAGKEINNISNIISQQT